MGHKMRAMNKLEKGRRIVNNSLVCSKKSQLHVLNELHCFVMNVHLLLM